MLDFWFGEIEPENWFTQDDAFDALVRQRFLKPVQQALAGKYDDWRLHPQSRLALIILLDQMPRNIFRGTKRAYDGDAMALDLTFDALLDNQLDTEPDANKRAFLLMPLMHSEELHIQEKAVALFADYCGDIQEDYAKRHLAGIEEFGRFPHRNEALGRKSSAAEKKYLKKPNAGF